MSSCGIGGWPGPSVLAGLRPYCRGRPMPARRPAPGCRTPPLPPAPAPSSGTTAQTSPGGTCPARAAGCPRPPPAPSARWSARPPSPGARPPPACRRRGRGQSPPRSDRRDPRSGCRGRTRRRAAVRVHPDRSLSPEGRSARGSKAGGRQRSARRRPSRSSGRTASPRKSAVRRSATGSWSARSPDPKLAHRPRYANSPPSLDPHTSASRARTSSNSSSPHASHRSRASQYRGSPGRSTALSVFCTSASSTSE
jgi:hypothetical protein